MLLKIFIWKDFLKAIGCCYFSYVIVFFGCFILLFKNFYEKRMSRLLYIAMNNLYNLDPKTLFLRERLEAFERLFRGVSYLNYMYIYIGKKTNAFCLKEFRFPRNLVFWFVYCVLVYFSIFFVNHCFLPESWGFISPGFFL